MYNNLSIFISYARAESAFVDKLEAEIKLYGFPVWVDRSKLHAGQEWIDKIENAINACDVLIVILSPQSVKSKYVRMEYRYALDKGKKVIPLLSEACEIPMDMNSLHRIDFHSSFDWGMKELLQTLRHALQSSHAGRTNSNSYRQGCSSAPDQIFWGASATQNNSGSSSSLQHPSNQAYSLAPPIPINQHETHKNWIQPSQVKEWLDVLQGILILSLTIGFIVLIVFAVLLLINRGPVWWVVVGNFFVLMAVSFVFSLVENHKQSIIDGFEGFILKLIEAFIGMILVIVFLIGFAGLITFLVCLIVALQGQPPLWWVWIVAIIGIVLGIIGIYLTKPHDISEVQ